MVFNLNDGAGFITQYVSLLKDLGYFSVEDPTTKGCDFISYYFSKDYNKLISFIDELKAVDENKKNDYSDKRSDEIEWIGTDWKNVDMNKEDLKRIFHTLGFNNVNITEGSIDVSM